MAVRNDQIAEFFYRMAELLEIQGANPFRMRAYRRAAIAIDSFPESVAGLLARGRDLSDLPAIGKDLAGKIREICDTGRLQALESLEAGADPALVALTRAPGLGPKRIAALREKLGVNSVEDLVKAASEGRIRALPGFGPAFEARLLRDLPRPA
jgi:DNA polymerase (family 10)